MKKKLAVAVLAALMSVTMMACGGQSGSSQQTASSTKTESTVSQKTASSEDSTLDMLNFIKEGEAYFDVTVTEALKDLKITVDGKDAIGAKKVSYTKDCDYAIESTAEPGKKVNIYIVSGNLENGNFRYTQTISQGIDAEHASNRLSDMVSKNLKGSSKFYIAITEEVKGWDHSLSEKLNQFLDGYAK